MTGSPSRYPPFKAGDVWPRAKRCLVLGYYLFGSRPPWSCHASGHTPAPFGRHDNSMAGGCLGRTPCALAVKPLNGLSVHMSILSKHI